MSDINRIVDEVRKARVSAKMILDYQDESEVTSSLIFDESIYSNRKEHITDMDPILNAAYIALRGFATIETSLVRTILSLKASLKDYVSDHSLKRPLNILMMAPPGSGKSHFVKCLAEDIGLPYIGVDLSAGNPYDVIAFALNEARNFKSQDMYPLIFLDEVDSHPEILPSLLPLMWDGQFSTTGHVLRVGKCVLVCAATNPDFAYSPKTSNGSYVPEFHAKLPDFLSRLNGGRFKIDSLNSEQRRFDRLAISAALIQRRFKTIRAVSIGLLQFLASLPIKHEVRSLEFFINLIPSNALQSWSFLRGPKNDNAIPMGTGALHTRFLELLEGRSYLSEALEFHIQTEHMPQALELWKRTSRNIDPVVIQPWTD